MTPQVHLIRILRVASQRVLSNDLGKAGLRGFVLLMLAGVAAGQEWQVHQLTNFPPNGQVRQCGAVMDSLGNVHHYFEAVLGYPSLNYAPFLYLRTDAYGHTLTDTVRLNPASGIWSCPSYASVVGNGTNLWALFADRVSEQSSAPRGLFLAERNLQGQEVLPATLLGTPADGEGPPDWGLAAVLRESDSTIHVVGVYGHYYYYRFRTTGEVLVWQQEIDGLRLGVGPKIHLGPDGAVWATMRDDDGQGHTNILLVRFGEDTSQTVYHPFAGTLPHWYPHEFGIDAAYNFHFLAGCDTATLGYYRLDSSMVIRERHTLEDFYEETASMRVDSAGNCLCVWDYYPGLYWAYRRADGTWPHPPTQIAADMAAVSFSLAAMDSDRFAFTAMGARYGTGAVDQLQLYTYGFGPDTVNAVPEPRHSTPAITLSAYPNPFNSTAVISYTLPAPAPVTLEVFSVLGRVVWRKDMGRVSAGEHREVFEGEGISSGVLFVKVTAGKDVRVGKMMLLK